MEVEDRWSNISKLLDYTHFEALGSIVFLNFKKFQLFRNCSVDIRSSVLRHVKPGCWPLYHRWNVRSRGNMGPYSLAKTLTNVMQHVTAWYSSDWYNPYIIKEQAFWGGACVCVNNVSTRSSPKMEHAVTRPTPNAVAVMTQQPASPPDVYSIALMTKSSSKVLGRFPKIKSITDRWLSYRKANSKTVRLYARPKFPGFERGSGCSLSL
jgi:hypothetical protein